MKKYLKYILYSTAGMVVLISSCRKKLEEAYINPNASVRQPIENVFPSLIGSFTGSSSAAGSAYGLAADALLIGRYIQYWGTYNVITTANLGTQYDLMGGTTGASDNMGSLWAAHYYGMGQNVNRIIEWGSEEEKWDYVGAAWACRAWSLLEASNQYGEMIVRQAFNTSLQQFLYDEQAETYDSVRATCHRALSFLNMTGGNMNPTNFAASDFYFNKGNLDKWKKFVYGILARSYAYLHNKTAYSADSVIKYANLSCQTNVDNIVCTFQNTGITGTMNYYGPARGNVNNTSTGIRQSAYIANLMSGANVGAFANVEDPRRWVMLRENTNQTFKGTTPGAGTSGLSANDQPRSFVGTLFSTVGYPVGDTARYIFRNAAEWPIMTASEMKFIKAEALIRKNDRTNALVAYREGISLNFDHLIDKYPNNVPASQALTTAKRDAYLNQPNIVPASAASLSLTHVMLQKYIACYAWGVHVTWADMRRYHYTDVDPQTATQVYVNFTLPASLFVDNAGKPVYRTRPRYNSEYLYNIPELTRIGAIRLDYHTKRPWFSGP
jgi:Starch-binding associating with outer membrane